MLYDKQANDFFCRFSLTKPSTSSYKALIQIKTTKTGGTVESSYAYTS